MTGLPVVRYVLGLLVLVTKPKFEVTVVALVQVQVASHALTKAKRVLQAHVTSTVFPESVCELKVIKTNCSLFEN